MFKRTLITAIAGFGACMSFGTMGTAGAMVVAKPMLTDSPSKVLKITELLINPDGSDNGNEYIEIKNTGPNSVEIKDVWFVYFDGETGQQGECDALVRLGNDGSGGVNGMNSRVLASGETLVIRDTNGGAANAISPTGGTEIDVDFDSLACFGSGPLHNSVGMFALISEPSGLAVGNKKDSNSNGLLDSTYWADTYDVVDMRQESSGSTSAFYSNSTLNDAGGDGFDKIQCAQQTNWTPDGFSRLQNTSTGTWTTGVMYDTQPKNGSNQYNFDSAEYKFANGAGGTPVAANSTNPRCTPGVTSPTTGTWDVQIGGTGTVYRH